METTYIKRRSLEEIRTEDEIHLLSAKLDQTREDIRSMTSKFGTWEELRDFSQELKTREKEIEMRRDIETELWDIMEERLRIIERNIGQRLDYMDMNISTKMREMGERLCYALDQFTEELSGRQGDAQDDVNDFDRGEVARVDANEVAQDDVNEVAQDDVNDFDRGEVAQVVVNDFDRGDVNEVAQVVNEFVNQIVNQVVNEFVNQDVNTQVDNKDELIYPDRSSQAPSDQESSQESSQI